MCPVDEWLLGIIEAAGYAGLALLMIVENLIPAIPSELILPFAGFLVADGQLGFAGVIASAAAGSTVGAAGWYLLGRAWGSGRVHRFIERHGCWMLLETDDVSRAEAWFERHQGVATFVGRLMPGVRSLISVPAGMARMPPVLFLAYTAAGSVLWTIALTAAGYLLADAYEKASDVVGPIGTILLASAVAFVVGRYLLRRRRRAARASA